MKLHEAILEVLHAHGGWMDRDEIAREVATRDLYRRGDGCHPPSDQIRLRVHSRSYAHLFECSDPRCSRIRLRMGLPEDETHASVAPRLSGRAAEATHAHPPTARRADEIERRRRRHRPHRVTLLFVGESPPAGGTFFYDENSTLYFETRNVFQSVLGERVAGTEGFLDAFGALGCYLDDLCLEPVNKLPKAERASRRLNAEDELAGRISEYEPSVVVAIGKTTAAPHVRRALDLTGLAGVRLEVLPFPGRPKHKADFANGLRRILDDARRRGGLCK